MIRGARGEELTGSWLGCKCGIFLGEVTCIMANPPSAVATLPRILRLVLLPTARDSLCGVLGLGSRRTCWCGWAVQVTGDAADGDDGYG